MVSRHCFELDWIAQIREKYPKTDPSIIEKTIYAFELLGLLIKNGVDFIFKGGTSMLLHIDTPRRLSIDIDIISNVDEGQLENIIRGTVFQRYELNKRTAGDIRKSHHKYYYYSKVNKREDYVLLDVVNYRNPYRKLIESKIQTDFFTPEKEMAVKIPTLDCLLGDKLTAFAPNTVGVPYNKNKSMSIIKQLIDVDDLFMNLKEPDDLSHTYQQVFEIENGFRSDQYTIDTVLADTIETCYLISQIDLKKSVSNDKTNEIRKGIQQIPGHLLINKYSLSESKLSAARIAYLATIMKYQRDNHDAYLKRYQANTITDSERIDVEKYSILNRIRNALPEAFYYWHLISMIEMEQN
ncbi:nucleotidyl transferase AbiEii/AbiGii toxin family protein [bacterium]|nr:nucleotidyl transferase AbiEii/AbiGii toxin family protein [bacterium]